MTHHSEVYKIKGKLLVTLMPLCSVIAWCKDDTTKLTCVWPCLMLGIP